MKADKCSFGVSEVIGFFLILGIMITGIGLVTLYGYPILLEQQANANFRNMERNMLVIQADVNALTYKSVPYKETMMQINGGTISIIKSDPTDTTQPYFTVHGVNNGDIQIGDPLGADPNRFYPGEIQFQGDTNNAIIGLQNGAVMIQYFNSGSSMLAKPRWFFDINPANGQRTLYITLIKITADQESSLNGVGTIRMEEVGSPRIIENSNPDTYAITYTSFGNYPNAWRNYFADQSVFPSPNCVPNGLSLDISTDKVIIVIHTQKISV